MEQNQDTQNNVKRFGTTHYHADAFSVDYKRELTYDVLGRELLNSADNQASAHAFGFQDLLKNNQSWVISRMTIEMNQMPPIYSAYHIDTWIESVYRLFTNRNFCIYDDHGNIFGYARSVWAMIDNNTRTPLDLDTNFGPLFQTLLMPERPCEIEGHSRIRSIAEVNPFAYLDVKYSDLDCNGHLNSIKYIAHVLDLFSKEYYDEHRIRRIEIAYVAEAYYGDTITFFVKELSLQHYQVEIRKHYDKDQKGETVARCLVTFDKAGAL